MANRELTVLFVPGDYVGAVMSSIGMAEVLRDSGRHRCVFAVTGGEKSRVERMRAIGFEVISIGEKADRNAENWAHNECNHNLTPLQTVQNLIQLFYEWYSMAAEVVDPYVRDVIADLKPDVIITDHLYTLPSIVTSGIPWIFSWSNSPLSLDYGIDDDRLPPSALGLPTNSDKEVKEKYRKLVNEAKAKLWYKHRDRVLANGCPLLHEYQLWTPSPFANFYMTPKELDYTDIRPLPDTFHGFDYYKRSANVDAFEMPEKLRNKSGKLLFLSLGSIGSGRVQLMKRLVAILAKSQHRIIVAKGVNHSQYELADNMWGDMFVPQIEVLPLIDLMLTHGGNNTVTETMYFGKPMIVLPLFFDQYDNAQRVQEKGFGVRLDPYECSEQQLLQSIDYVLNDKIIAENCKLLGVCISANLSPDLSYMSMYAVLKEYQGLGIGTALWDKAIKHMGDRNVSLFVENRKMRDIYYNRCNFRVVPKRRALVMSGNFVANSLTASIPGIRLVDMNDNNIADVIEYDKQYCCGRDRSTQLRAHIATDPEGAVVAQHITTGELLGLCGIINLSPELSYVVIYAVRDECQGLGIGTALWDKAIKHVGDRNITLQSSEPKITDVYKNRQNFTLIPERKIVVMKGKPVVNALTASIRGISLVDMNDKNIADVIEYDKQVCDGLDRSAQLRALNGPFNSIGTVVAQDITTGELLGVCQCVNLSPELSFLMVYAVRQEYQELGIGSALWDRVIEHIGDRNVFLLSSSKKMQDLYKNKHNFRFVPQRRRLVMTGKPVVNNLITTIDGISVVDINDSNIADVIEYDKQVCDGLDRSAQLRALNGQFKTASLVAINDNNQVLGYCFISDTVSGDLFVSPLYADNQQIAELLVGKYKIYCPGISALCSY
ncbi:unnamed protein product [Medioppia subpectinata]|uniref:N-acetyltransferase domain-containing protein n=1 Tax=Medioppia subpectinata TaxID=1979941 RepID=A0A7R9KGU2_9ACAR|nr:unnamed protein product [Medioppia subpectinata]CAG2103007.1 unnamed protein product [Medioppia subpectinata]